MTEFKTIVENVERKTYLKGKLRGKYFGFLDDGLSDLIHENFYSMEFLEASVEVEHITKWDQGGEFDDFKFVDLFSTQLPPRTSFHVSSSDGSTKIYYIRLKDIKVKDINLCNQVYEGNKVFGTIEGEICGYISRIEQTTEHIPIRIKESNGGVIKESGLRDEVTEKENEKTESNIVEANEETRVNNKEELNQIPPSLEQVENDGFWKKTGSILQSILTILFVLPLLYIGWPFLLIIGASMLFQFIGHLIQPVFRYIGKPFISIVWILFLSTTVFSLIEYLSKGAEMVVSSSPTKDLPVERTDYEEVEEIGTDIPEIESHGTKDSIITHYRVWKDYTGIQYQGFIKLKYSDLKSANNYHQSIATSGDGIDFYNQLLQQFLTQDSNSLSGVYSLFDTLRSANKLDKKAFAEVIVSCVQDIPYTLILDKACDPSLYNDKFIDEYLSNGGVCHPFVKFGIYSPVEFIATLHGDCDTRALLLFTLLQHYGYDVTMLSNEVYKHSVIAINMPYLGTSKIINGKRYVIWETTRAGIPPGVFPHQISNMDLWFVNLISTNSIVQ